MRSFRLSRLLLPLLLAIFTAFAGAASAATPADGPWRLRLDLSSFFDGHIGTIHRVVELRGGYWEGTIRQGQMLVGLRVDVVGGAVSGLMSVKAGSDWNSVSMRFHGVVVDGIMERHLVGPATYNLSGGAGRHGPQQRDVDIDFLLEQL